MTDAFDPLEAEEDFSLTTEERSSAERRLMARLSEPDEKGCRVYLGNRVGGRYGLMRVGKTMMLTHRVAFFLANGPFPKRLNVLHRCDNPPCSENAHLYLGTQRENMRDAVRKNRLGNRKGERNSFSRLNDTVVRQIRAFTETGMVSQRQLARMFGVEKTTIAQVQRGKTWSHVR